MSGMWTRVIVVSGGVLVLGLGARTPVHTQGTAGNSAAGPVQLSRDEDFQRTRALLGITTPPPAGASGTSPDTYNEATANPYPNLPDPLVMTNGSRVTSAAMWNSRRRGELIDVFEREIYGRTPKTTPKVAWTVTSTT